MKQFKRIILSALVLSLLLTLAACSGETGSGETGSKPEAKTDTRPAAKTESSGASYTWAGAGFTVKSITEVDKTEDDGGKRIAVTIDFGKNQLSQSTFQKNISAGKLLLAGKKPVTYDYHVGSMTLEASGMVTKITGVTVLYFDMDADYEINEADLVITE